MNPANPQHVHRSRFQRGGNAAPGRPATASNHSVAGVQAAHAADYDVVVTDVAGSVTSQVAVLAVILPPPPSIRVNDGSLGFSGGRFGFNISGQAGQVVVVEASPTLQPDSWTAIWTNTLGSGPLYFSDPQSPANGSWYYRARLP